MKARHFVFGALGAILAVGVALLSLSDLAFAAPAMPRAALVGHSWGDMVIQASPALLALRAQLTEATSAAAAKIAEVVDGLDADKVRSIEAEHKALLDEAEGIRSQISAEESRIAAPAPTAPDLVAQATARAADILSIGLRAGMSRDDIDASVRGQETVEQFRTRAFDALASRNGNQPLAPRVQVTQDETQTRLDGLTDAIVWRALAGQPGRPQLSENGRRFHEHRFSDAAAEILGVRMPRLPAQREELIQRAFHTTPDFPALLENAARRAALSRYSVAPTTFQRWSAQRTFVDFRPHSMVRGGDFPGLLQVGEAGELKVGTVSESREVVSALTYGRQVRIGRNVFINDDLGEFGRILGSAGDRVARLRNQIAYQSLMSNSAQGPLLATPNRNMFVAGNTNLGTAGVISITTIGEGRALMARQNTLDGLALSGNVPSILLCDWTRLTAAQQLLAPIVPAQTSNAVPGDFQQITPVADAELGTTTRWWMFADPAVTPNFVYGTLEGASDFYTRTQEPPGVLGMAFEVYFDFAFGAIDWRGGMTNAG
jgi:hypothetical protein